MARENTRADGVISLNFACLRLAARRLRRLAYFAREAGLASAGTRFSAPA